MADAELQKLADDLKRKSDADLAAFRADKNDTSLYAILADKEFARRDRLRQHELDLKLIARQVRWMKFAAIAMLVAAIVGGAAGAALTYWLQKSPPQVQSTPPQVQSTPPAAKAQQQKGRAMSGPKEKAESVPSRTPKVRD